MVGWLRKGWAEGGVGLSYEGVGNFDTLPQGGFFGATKRKNADSCKLMGCIWDWVGKARRRVHLRFLARGMRHLSASASTQGPAHSGPDHKNPMRPKFLPSVKLFAVLAAVFHLTPVRADIVVTWENDAGDLVIRWNGDISNWTRQHNGNGLFFTILQANNGMHAIDDSYDLSFTGTAHNWYIGPNMGAGAGVMTGDTFGTSGLSTWIYMPRNYAGQVISGSLTYAGQGALISAFVEGSRDLGFGSNDNIIFRAAAASVPDAGSSLVLVGLSLLGFAGMRRRFAK